MGTTPEYTKNAINKYNAKFDRVAVNLPKGTKDKIKELTGKSCNAYINDLVLAGLARLESHTKHKTDQRDNLPNSFAHADRRSEAQKRKDEARKKELLQEFADMERGVKQRTSNTSPEYGTYKPRGREMTPEEMESKRQELLQYFEDYEERKRKENEEAAE